MQKLIFLSLVSLLPFLQPSSGVSRIDVDWNNILTTSKTTITCQAVTNPKYLRDSDIHNPIFDNLKKLNVTYARLAAWYPYPHLVVAELDPPTSNKTFWDFTYMDQIVVDFMAATGDRQPLMSLSTIPQWMFKTAKRVPYPADPKQADFGYSITQGTELRDPTMKELTGYYKRLVQWYTKGGFYDELGQYHHSGYKYPFKLWEVFNEIENEHKTTPKQYTERYDAVVKAIREVDPDMKFVGLALASPNKDGVDYVSYFLNSSNHQPGVPIDYISYHYYAYGHPGDDTAKMQHTFIQQADQFINTVKQLEVIRKKLSPTTKVDLNEIGSMYLPATTQPIPKPIPEGYFQLSGANFAYVLSHLIPLGIDIVGMSQFVGFPSQFPSLTMINWTNGEPNYRYAVLQLVLSSFVAGDRIVKSTVDSDDVATMAAIASDGAKKVLLVNKRMNQVLVETGFRIQYLVTIDKTDNKLVKHQVGSNQCLLDEFDVAVLHVDS